MLIMENTSLIFWFFCTQALEFHFYMNFLMFPLVSPRVHAFACQSFLLTRPVGTDTLGATSHSGTRAAATVAHRKESRLVEELLQHPEQRKYNATPGAAEGVCVGRQHGTHRLAGASKT